MLIVIGILALISTIAAFNIGRMHRQQRFRTGVEQIIDRLQMAQNLMLVLKTDVNIAIRKNDRGIYSIHMEVETPLPKHLEDNASRQINLEGIEEMSFDRGNGESRTDQIVLKYSALYKRIPEGVFILRQNQEMEESIPLYGYPHPVAAGDKKDERYESFPNESLNIYPAEVREEWQRILESKQEKEKEAVPAS